jgi:hypothetical protein
MMTGARHWRGAGSIAVTWFLHLACDGPWQFPAQPPSVRNATPTRLRFHVKVQPEAIACDEAASGARHLATNEFVDGGESEVAGGDYVPLHAQVTPGNPVRETDLDCGVALITDDTGKTLRATWDLRNVIFVNTPDVLAPGVILMEQFGAELRPNPGEGTFVFAADGSPLP